MLSVLIPMMIFALVGAITPGPVNLVATSAGARFGSLRALPHVIGATLGYTLVVYLCGIGVGELIDLYPVVLDTLRYAGAALLLYLAWKIATTSPTTRTQASQEQAPRLMQGALLQILNPKAWLVALTGISLFVSLHPDPALSLLLFCAVSFLACFIGVGFWACAGQLIGRFLASQRAQMYFYRLMGVLLGSTVVTLFI
ncbi:Transporter, LysE family [Marinobacterium lacunae]|uniref:Transporter, LysE family n=2 Tax=Marinobacterium lacunae TaxID=1232683 RepID=A0A081FUU3_9GAMM|nr:Transporter, LysE family [Marinobacterium lacunae]MBR9883588.1 LysE family translocator [Oceanospirillales bacterium]